MPELPEVETIRRQLEKEIVGRRVMAVDVRFAKRLNLPPAEFAKRLVGKRVAAIRRRAKLLLIELSGGRTLVVHLKMTGRLLVRSKGAARTKHTHVIIALSGGRELHFEDVRKFGFMRLLPSADVEKKILAPLKLGPEPLEKDFSADEFASCLKRRGRAAIKPLLLSQTCVAGLGNIYADESCWLAQVRPSRPAGKLTRAEARRLHDAIRDVLKRAVRLGGSSVDDYRDAYGRQGGFAPKLQAYGRAGEPCSRCGQPIRKTRLGGRGTHYCARCQR